MYDTFLPLSTNGHISVGSLEAPSQPSQATHNDANHSISDADLHDALTDERADIEETKIMLKWMLQTLRGSKLDVP